MALMPRAAVFLDKDGTLIHNVPYNVDPARMRLTANSVKGLQALSAADYPLVVISNQSGVAHGHFAESELEAVECRLRELLAEHDIPLAGWYYCPHHPRGIVSEYAVACRCRKPQPGLLYRAADTLRIDLAQSWFVGDILDDVEAGRRAGCRTILLDNGNETEWILNSTRVPHSWAVDINDAADTILHNAPQETWTAGALRVFS